MDMERIEPIHVIPSVNHIIPPVNNEIKNTPEQVKPPKEIAEDGEDSERVVDLFA